MSLFSLDVTLTTAIGGAATGYTSAFTGFFHTIAVDKGDLAVTSDITITNETTGEAIVTLTDVATDKAVHPRVLQQDAVGVNVAGEYTDVFVNGRVKIVVAQGGDAKSGTVRFDILGEGDALAAAFASRVLTNPTGPAYVDNSKPPYLSDGSV